MANHLTKFIQRNKILRAITASLILICVLFHAAPTAAMTGDDIFNPAPAPIKDPGITATGNLSFSAGSTLDVEIGGITPGVGGYDQIIVNGTVTIASNVTLSTTAWGGYTPSVGDSYRIISNDGADAVTGTFDGLPEGGFISNFLGSGEAAQITYAGGDGNDVVLTVITAAPEIDIQYPMGTSIADGGTHDLGIRTPGSTITLNYVYDNSFGSDVLTVSAVGSQNYVNISGMTLTSPPPANLPARSTASIGFQFQVGSPGPFSFDWYVNTNDADENPYNVHVAGLAGDDKHIIVQRPAGTAIADGGSDDLGNQSINTVNVTYTVDNTAGLGALTVSDVTASNFTNATNFSLDTAMPVTVAAGGTSSFDISFDVLVNGAFSFDLDVLNDDADTSTYDIAVSGTMDDIPPSVTIDQAATQLDPTTASPIHFTAVFSEPVTGFATGDVTLSGTAGATTATVTEIAPNDGTTYNVAVSGMTADGTVTAVIGAGVAADGAGNGNTISTFTDNTVSFDGGPEIDMQRPALISIIDGGTDALGNRGIGTVNLTYTVSNITGSDVLTITDVIATNLTNVSNFSLDSATPINVAGGATGTFDVSFDVGVNGAFGFDMDIANNDSDEANYDIAVSGTGTGGTPEIDIQRPAGTSINDGGADMIGTPGVGVVNLTYTVDNSTGTAQLSVFGVTAANETNVSGFALGTAAPINVPAGGTDSFDISFNVDAAGAFSFDMDIVNEDADETNYDIAVSGVAADLVVVMGGNTSPLDGDLFTDGPTALSVEFNKETLAGGAGVPGAADNPANYLLVEDGPSNNGFDTVSCAGGVAVDDVSIAVDSVAYDVGTFTATVNVNGGTALPDGSYRLFICGTTSVEDLLGFELNNGLADTLISFLVEREEEAAAATFLPATGFAPGQVTVLPAKPASLIYANTVMVLEIPSLGERMPILSVPQSAESWNVTWLGGNAGYLSGTAFPTWAGNTVLTGHVWDALNRPGPFANVKSLQYGEHINIHAFGMTYVYEVRENTLLQPTQVGKALQHEDFDWVTLLTCERYDTEDGDYELRRMVRAVLVEVK